MTKQFILIMADTVRKDMLGCYGNPGTRPTSTGYVPKASGTTTHTAASPSAAPPAVQSLPACSLIPTAL